MKKQDEKLKKVKICTELLIKTLKGNLENLSKESIISILEDIIEIIDK